MIPGTLYVVICDAGYHDGDEWISGIYDSRARALAAAIEAQTQADAMPGHEAPFDSSWVVEVPFGQPGKYTDMIAWSVKPRGSSYYVVPLDPASGVP